MIDILLKTICTFCVAFIIIIATVILPIILVLYYIFNFLFFVFIYCPSYISFKLKGAF